MRQGAIILCGGNSSRMGRDKASLPFGPERMLERVVRLVGEAIAPQRIVVVAAPDQILPELPVGISIAHDRQRGRGPLEGLAAGLRVAAAHSDAVYATACDVPLLVPAFITRMFELLGDHDIAIPRDGAFHHPLAAVYRVTVLEQIERLLAADRLRTRDLFAETHTREVPIEDLREVDPRLSTLQNLNDPEAYRAALAAAGFTQI